MLAVSQRFTDAEQADVNQIASKFQLVLGNYAAAANGSTVSASGSDVSGNYPASGAIDGDRTEINVGAASAADNDVGLSSWRSAVAPSVTPQTLTINFGQSRTINRLKLYHLSSHGLSSYKLESSADNVSYSLIAKTTDQGGTIATTHQVDTIDFDDLSCHYVKLTIANTVVVADKANVVELEAYRLIDITDRVVGAKVNRSRDYKIGNPLASTLTLSCNNSDRFFSFSHVPSASEVVDGFVNTELGPNVGVIAEYGFAYGGGEPELATVFVGYIDRIKPNPRDQSAVIECRDPMKRTLNGIISSKLKTSIDIAAAITYALNLRNFSTFEMSIETTGITLDNFFIANQSVLTVVRELTTAAGDAIFYFDEDGLPIFKTFLGQTPQSQTQSSESDFNAGTLLQNIDTSSSPGEIRRKWFLIDDFGDGNFNSNPVWNNRVPPDSVTDDSQADFDAGTVKTNIATGAPAGEIRRKWFTIDNFTDLQFTSNPAWTNNGRADWTAVSGKLAFEAEGKNGQAIPAIGVSAVTTDGLLSVSNNGKMSGTWRWEIKIVNAAAAGKIQLFFAHNGFVNLEPLNTSTFSHRTFANGYYIELVAGSFPVIGKTNGSGIETVICNSNSGGIDNNTTYSIRLTRTSDGTMQLFVNEVLVNLIVGGNVVTSVQDNSISSATLFGLRGVDFNTGGALAATYTFDAMYYSPDLDGTGTIDTGQSIFESQVFDQSAQVLAEGSFDATYDAPAGTTVSFFTATSADGISWDSYLAVTPGGLVQSTVRRYLKYKVLFVTPADAGTNNDFTSGSVQSVTIKFTVDGWQCILNAAKYLPGTSGLTAGLDLPFLLTTGTWRCNVTMTPGTGVGMAFRMYIMTTGFSTPISSYASGYYAQVDQANGKLGLYEINSSGTRTLLAEFAVAINTSVHSLRVTRNSAGQLTLYWDEVQKAQVTDTSFSATAAFAFEVNPLVDQNGNVIVDNVNYSAAIDGTGAISTSQAIFESEVVDMTAAVTALGIFQASYVTPSGTSVDFYTATSSDGITFDAYEAASNGGAIGSAIKRYLKWKAVMTTPTDGGTLGVVITPSVSDVTINWSTGTGSSKFPSSVSFVFADEGMLLDLTQEISDVLGGDTAILNNIAVQAKPLILAGANTDVQWQGTVQTPPVAISVSAPLSVTNGQTLTYKLSISGGMDVSRMSGGSPAAAAITFAGGGAGSWVFSKIHPTKPILVITITGTGTITGLQVQGKGFSNSSFIAEQVASDATSIALYDERDQTISNQYIVNSGIALLIATRLLANYKNAVSYVPMIRVRPIFSGQIGDRVTIQDYNTDLSADFIIVGLTHTIQAGMQEATAETALTLLKVV